MEIMCPHCLGTGISPITNETCHICNGDNNVEAYGDHAIIQAHVIEAYTQIVVLQATVAVLADVVADIKNKCDDIFEKVNE